MNFEVSRQRYTSHETSVHASTSRITSRALYVRRYTGIEYGQIHQLIHYRVPGARMKLRSPRSSSDQCSLAPHLDHRKYG